MFVFFFLQEIFARLNYFTTHSNDCKIKIETKKKLRMDSENSADDNRGILQTVITKSDQATVVVETTMKGHADDDDNSVVRCNEHSSTDKFSDFQGSNSVSNVFKLKFLTFDKAFWCSQNIQCRLLLILFVISWLLLGVYIALYNTIKDSK